MTELFLARSSLVPIEVKPATIIPAPAPSTPPPSEIITVPPTVVPPAPVEVPPTPAVPWESIVIAIAFIGGIVILIGAVYFYGVGK